MPYFVLNKLSSVENPRIIVILIFIVLEFEFVLLFNTHVSSNIYNIIIQRFGELIDMKCHIDIGDDHIDIEFYQFRKKLTAPAPN
jgi:hypothetical protein